MSVSQNAGPSASAARAGWRATSPDAERSAAPSARPNGPGTGATRRRRRRPCAAPRVDARADEQAAAGDRRVAPLPPPAATARRRATRSRRATSCADEAPRARVAGPCTCTARDRRGSAPGRLVRRAARATAVDASRRRRRVDGAVAMRSRRPIPAGGRPRRVSANASSAAVVGAAAERPRDLARRAREQPVAPRNRLQRYCTPPSRLEDAARSAAPSRPSTAIRAAIAAGRRSACGVPGVEADRSWPMQRGSGSVRGRAARRRPAALACVQSPPARRLDRRQGRSRSGRQPRVRGQAPDRAERQLRPCCAQPRPPTARARPPRSRAAAFRRARRSRCAAPRPDRDPRARSPCDAACVSAGSTGARPGSRRSRGSRGCPAGTRGSRRPASRRSAPRAC